MLTSPRLGVVPVLLLSLCLTACETRRDQAGLLGQNVVGDDLVEAFGLYDYHELVGTHGGSVSHRRFAQVRIPLADQRPPEQSNLRLPPRFSPVEEVHILSPDGTWISDQYDYAKRDSLLRRADPSTGRWLGDTVRVPANTTEFAEDRLHLFTPSNRVVVALDRGGVTAFDFVGNCAIDVPGLAELIARCKRVCGPTARAQAQISDDLEHLVVIPAVLSELPGVAADYGKFTLDGRDYSFRDYGYCCDRTTLTVRPLPVLRDGLRLTTAESVKGRLMLLYVEVAPARGRGTRLLWVDADDRVRFLAQTPTEFRVGLAFADPVRDRIVFPGDAFLFGDGPATLLWYPAAGKFVETAPPPSREFIRAAVTR